MSAQKEAKDDFRNVAMSIVIAITKMADSLRNIEECENISVKTWKTAINMLVDCFKKKALKNEIYSVLVANIMEYDKSYKDPLTQETPLDKLKTEFKVSFTVPKALVNPTERSNIYAEIEKWKVSISNAKKEFIAEFADFSTKEESEKSLQDFLNSLRKEELGKLFRVLVPEFADETKINKAVQKFLEVSELLGSTKEEGKGLLSKISKENIEIAGNKGCSYIMCWFFAIMGLIVGIFEDAGAFIGSAITFIIIFIMTKNSKERRMKAEILDQKLISFYNTSPQKGKSESGKSVALSQTSGKISKTRNAEPESNNTAKPANAQELVKKALELLK